MRAVFLCDDHEQRIIENRTCEHCPSNPDNQFREIPLLRRLLGTWVFNTTTNQLYWDREMCKLFGHEEDGLIGNFDTFKDRVYPDDFPAVEQAVIKALDTKSKYEAVYRVVRKMDRGVVYMHAWGSVFEIGDDIFLIGSCDEVGGKADIINEMETKLKS